MCVQTPSAGKSASPCCRRRSWTRGATRTRCRRTELSLELQTVIKLRFYEELSLREISEATGWNLNTVKTRLYTALKKLRVSLEGEESYG